MKPQLSERDKIIMNLKSELFDIQQNAKNIKKLEETNNEYQNENKMLYNKKNKLEFMLDKTKEQTSKQISDLKLEIKNLNEELNKKKDTNIKLFIEKESLEKKLDIMTVKNNNLSKKIKSLMERDTENGKLIEKFRKKLNLYENGNNNTNCQKVNAIKDIKDKYDKNIVFFQKKVNELQLAINQLYCDNKKLVKIYKIAYNKKEINKNIILTLIKSNLLPKNIIKDVNHCKTDYSNSRINQRNNYNKDIINSIDSNYSSAKNIVIATRIKTPSREYLHTDKNENLKYESIKSKIIDDEDISRCKSTSSKNIIIKRNQNQTENDDVFSPYGYDINKTYNFEKMKAIKKAKKKISQSLNKKINDKNNFNLNVNLDLYNSVYGIKNDKYFCELINTQEENIMLKKQVLNLAKQNEDIIDEIDNIVKISGMDTIDVTSEGVKHLEQIIFNNRELLGKYLNEVRKYKT